MNERRRKRSCFARFRLAAKERKVKHGLICSIQSGGYIVNPQIKKRLDMANLCFIIDVFFINEGGNPWEDALRLLFCL